MQLVLLFCLLLLLPKPSAIVQAQAVLNDRARAEGRHLSPVSAPQFAVQLPGQGENTAREIAERYGLKFITKVGLYFIAYSTPCYSSTCNMS